MDKHDRYIVKVNHGKEEYVLTVQPTKGIHAIGLTAAWAAGVAVGCDGWVVPMGTAGAKVIGHYAVKSSDARHPIAEVWAEAV